MEIITNSTQETQEAGRKFGSHLKAGEVIALYGDLGSGKTTFVQGLARGLGIEDRISSPTFIISRVYDEKLYHVDLYRLSDANIYEELENLGLIEAIEDEQSIVIIEWADKMKKYLPENVINISFENIDENRRKIKIL